MESCFYAGLLIGSLVIPFVYHRFNAKAIVTTCTILNAISGSLVFFFENYYVLLVSRILVGFFQVTNLNNKSYRWINRRFSQYGLTNVHHLNQRLCGWHCSFSSNHLVWYSDMLWQQLSWAFQMILIYGPMGFWSKVFCTSSHLL